MQLPFKFHKFPRKQGQTTMPCNLLKDSVEKGEKSEDDEMDSVKSRDSLSSSYYFPCAPHLKKINKIRRNLSFHQTNTQTASLVPSFFNVSTRRFTTRRQFQITCYGGISLWGIYSIQPLAFLLNTCQDDIIPFIGVSQACISTSYWYRASCALITLNTKLIHSLKKYLLTMLCEGKTQYYTSPYKNMQA